MYTHEKTTWSEEIMVIFTVIKIDLSNFYQSFPAHFAP